MYAPLPPAIPNAGVGVASVRTDTHQFEETHVSMYSEYGQNVEMGNGTPQ